MSEIPFDIRPDDQRFFSLVQPGDPLYVCSRCAKPIDDDTVPILAWPESGLYEYRFHPSCLGFDDLHGDGGDDDDDAERPS